MGFRDFTRHAIRSLLWRMHFMGKPRNLYKSQDQRFERAMGFREFALYQVRSLLRRVGFPKAPENLSDSSTLMPQGEMRMV